jgi:hypothetical protein
MALFVNTHFVLDPESDSSSILYAVGSGDPRSPAKGKSGLPIQTSRTRKTPQRVLRCSAHQTAQARTIAKPQPSIVSRNHFT